MESINTRLKDMRYPYGQKKIQQQELAAMLDIPPATINEYEQEGNYVPSNVIIKYCQHFNVSADYLLGLTDIINKPNTEIHELHLSDRAMDKLKNQEINPWLLTEIIEHEQFNGLMMDANVYVNGFMDEGIHNYNKLLDYGREQLLSEASTSLKKEIDLETLSMVRIDQDNFFAHQMQERLRVILHDIKDKHKDDLDTSDYKSDKATDFYNEIVEAMQSVEGSNGKKLLVAIRTAFMSLSRIKNTDANITAASRLLSDNMDESTAEALLTQSELVEPNARKRRKAAKKLKDNQ